MGTSASFAVRPWTALASLLLVACGGAGHDANPPAQGNGEPPPDPVDAALMADLQQQGFTGQIESTLEARLGRPLDQPLAELGQKLFFDSLVSLYDDNSCAACHAPQAGMGDTQSIAIGIQNNGLVGPGRTGPRNQRRSPSVINSAFFPKLMWNGRFESLSGDPFSNALGFKFPPPEGQTRFRPNDPAIRHLLVAQAHMPPTELAEVAGFRGVTDLGTRFLPFDDDLGGLVPPPDASGSRNEPIRQSVLQRLNDSLAYRDLFGARFAQVRNGAPIDFSMFGQAIAEFEFTLVRANAPVDQYARGRLDALTLQEKQGALIFFGKGRCVQCHSVSGNANQMFSDFKMHNIGVPQIAPAFGLGQGNMVFDGAGEDEDFGLAQVTGAPADRYLFRSSPLRNVALQPAFFHNGAFTRLEDAVAHHLDPARSARAYDAASAGVAADLRERRGPTEPVLATLDPVLRTPIRLTEDELRDLVEFVRHGLLDPRAGAATLCQLVPQTLPSERGLQSFEGC